MKTRFLLLSLAATAMVSFSACSDDDDDVKTGDVPKAYVEALQAKYPESANVNVEWEQNGQYYVAEYAKNSMQEYEVWFGAKAEWAMTEVDYGKNLFFLPGEVEQAFAESVYGTGNTVDDVHMYERTADTYYLVEVELASDNSDVYIYINSDGTILKPTTTKIDVTPTTVF